MQKRYGVSKHLSFSVQLGMIKNEFRQLILKAPQLFVSLAISPLANLKETTMVQEDKDRLRNHIRQEIEALKKDMVALKKGAKPVSPDNAIGRITRMEAINSKSISEASLRNAEAKLAKLKRALEMIDDPAFGLCVECGEPIPFKRLMIMPEAIMCVGCAGRR